MGTRQQLFEEKSLLARFAEAAGSGDDLKAAYENEIGHATARFITFCTYTAGVS